MPTTTTFISAASALLVFAACERDRAPTGTTETTQAPPGAAGGGAVIGEGAVRDEQGPGRETTTTGATATGPGAAQPVIAVDPGAPDKKQVTHAIATLQPTKGNQINGTVQLDAVPQGVRVKAQLRNVPKGKHAFHVHVYGDCSGPEAKTAGPHFNFEGSSLSPPAGIQRITGDLGEIEPDAAGNATFEATVPKASLQGAYSILGRSVVVHAQPNDPTKPPEGGAGARLACGVIGVDEAATK